MEVRGGLKKPAVFVNAIAFTSLMPHAMNKRQGRMAINATKAETLTITSEPAKLTSIMAAMMLSGTQAMPPESFTPAYGSKYCAASTG